MSATLCSLDDVKNFLGIKGAVSEDDELIESLCERITTIFTNYCGLSSFFSANYTEYHDGTDTKYLFPKNFPITYVTAVYVDQDWLFDEAYTTGLYKVVNDRYIVMRDDIIPVGDQNVKIEYTAGFSTIPYDLKQAAVEEVARKFKRRKEIDVESKTLQDGTANYIKDSMLNSTKEVLKIYRRMDVI
jgi:hypothetical protein